MTNALNQIDGVASQAQSFWDAHGPMIAVLSVTLTHFAHMAVSKWANVHGLIGLKNWLLTGNSQPPK